MATGTHIVIAPPTDLWVGQEGGTAALFASLFEDGTDAPINGKNIHFDFDDASGVSLGGGTTGATGTNGLASVTVSLPAGLAAGDYDVRAYFDGDATYDAADRLGTLHVDPAPPKPPDPSTGTQAGSDADQPSALPPDDTLPDVDAIDPFTGRPAADPYTGVSNVDPYTGQPAADPFSGQPLSMTDRAVRDLINRVFDQPPVDFTGVPQDVQNAILDAFNQEPIDSRLADAVTQLYQAPRDFRQEFYDAVMAQQGMTISEYLGLNFSDRIAAGISDALYNLRGFTQDLESTYDSVARDFDKIARVARQVQGGFQAVGGVLQAVEGVTFAIGTAETGVGFVAGIAYAANGLDNAWTGLLRATGEDVQTTTYDIVKGVTDSSTAARIVDVGVPLAGGFGLSRLSALNTEASIFEGASDLAAADRIETSVAARSELADATVSGFKNDAQWVRGQETLPATAEEAARYEAGMRLGGREVSFAQTADGQTFLRLGDAESVSIRTGPDVELQWHSHPDAPALFSGQDILSSITQPAADSAWVSVTGPKWPVTNSVLLELGQAPEKALVTTGVTQAEINVVGASRPHGSWDWLAQNPP